jgi:hypothetical protein
MPLRPRSLLALVLLATPVAHAGGVAVGAQAGTLGLGVGLTVGLTEQFNVRGLFNTLSYEFDDEASDIEYEFDLDLGSVGAMIDWHPGGSGFRVSAGAFLNDNEVTGVGRPVDGTFVEIGDTLFPAEAVDRAEADLSFDDFVPYVGIGWGNAVGPDKRLGVNLDVGVLFQGAPQADFRAFAAGDAPDGLQDLLDQEAAREEAEIQDDLDQFEFYPVVSLGLSWKF